MLQTARALGQRLVVVLSHDSHNRKPNAVAARERLRRLKALGVADEVLVGDPDSFARSLRKVHPDILVLGYDQKLPDEETQSAVRELGIETVVLPWFPGKQEELPS
jgi:glycerol-3-phosphate cytidylyltransferase-like family protein